MLSYAAKFNINKSTPLSGHCSITVHLKCLSGKKYDIMMDNMKANVRYKWNSNDAEIYVLNINRDGTKRTLLDLSNKVVDTEDIGVMNEVTQQIHDVILTSAEHCKKKTVARRNKMYTLEKSKWYDAECGKQRQIYNTQRNLYA